MGTKIDFLYLSEQDMIDAGVKDMGQCVEVMEDMMVTLQKGDYVMGGENHNSHGCMLLFRTIRNLRECQRTERIVGLWQCLHILVVASKWLE